MSPERLLKHFERIADAPDAVPRLRRFILDLAVRGKLVEQDPKDGQAERPPRGVGQKSVLLESDAGKPFEVPETWVWLRLGDIGDWGSGSTPPRGHSEYYGGGITWLKSGELADKTDLRGSEETVTQKALEQGSFRRNKAGDVLIAMYGATIGKLAILAEDAVTNQAVCGCTPFSGIMNRYLFTFLLSQREAFRGQSEGGAQPNISKVKIVNTPFALPPLAEQHRIVAKVDELMGLCDELEAAQAKRESRRDRLVAATLHGLNNGEAEAETGMSFPETARFYFNHLPRLTTRPEHIQQLRQTILNLAVRGHLVPQDPNDEPVDVLLKRIKPLERPPRYASRSPELIIGDCGLSVGDPKTPLPKGWTRAPMTEIARLESGHTPSRNRPDWWGGDISWMGLVDARIHHGRVITETIQHTNPQGIANSAARVLPAGTVCFSRTASVGYVVVMGRPMATSQDFVNWVPTEAVTSRWLQVVLIAEKPALHRFSKGAVHQTIYYPAWLSMHISLPPLTEQKRIVAKVDELMALCDELETHLTEATTTRRQLLEATLAEALAHETGCRRIANCEG